MDGEILEDGHQLITQTTEDDITISIYSEDLEPLRDTPYVIDFEAYVVGTSENSAIVDGIIV